jgi:hypothetical protein
MKKNPEESILTVIFIIFMVLFIYYLIYIFTTEDTTFTGLSKKDRLIKKITNKIEDDIDTQINKYKPKVGKDNINKRKIKKSIIVKMKSDKTIETKTFDMPNLEYRTISELEDILSKKDNIYEFKKILERYGYRESVKSMLIKL